MVVVPALLLLYVLYLWKTVSRINKKELKKGTWGQDINAGHRNSRRSGGGGGGGSASIVLWLQMIIESSTVKVKE